jgi:hypothetical protein
LTFAEKVQVTLILHWIITMPLPPNQVTRTDFVQPTVSTILSEIGGSLGLWLGLGAVQAAQLLVQLGLILANRLRGTA